ncbi:unnamed protein product [Prunus brigantina]
MTMKVCEHTTGGEWSSRSIIPTVIDVAPLKSDLVDWDSELSEGPCF